MSIIVVIYIANYYTKEHRAAIFALLSNLSGCSIKEHKNESNGGTLLKVEVQNSIIHSVIRDLNDSDYFMIIEGKDNLD